MKEKLLKSIILTGIYVCIMISTIILFFNGSFGYFIYILTLGEQRGEYIFSTVALIGALLAIIPLLFHKVNNKFYYYVLLSTNALIIFYPIIIDSVAAYILPKFLK